MTHDECGGSDAANISFNLLIIKGPVEVGGRICRVVFTAGSFACQIWQGNAWKFVDPLEALVRANSVSSHLYVEFGLGPDGESPVGVSPGPPTVGKLLMFDQPKGER